MLELSHAVISELMSEDGRPPRGIERVNYAEPGDNPDESALEDTEVVESSAASVDTSFVSLEDQESFASV